MFMRFYPTDRQEAYRGSPYKERIDRVAQHLADQRYSPAVMAQHLREWLRFTAYVMGRGLRLPLGRRERDVQAYVAQRMTPRPQCQSYSVRSCLSTHFPRRRRARAFPSTRLDCPALPRKSVDAERSRQLSGVLGHPSRLECEDAGATRVAARAVWPMPRVAGRHQRCHDRTSASPTVLLRDPSTSGGHAVDVCSHNAGVSRLGLRSRTRADRPARGSARAPPVSPGRDSRCLERSRSDADS